jgi:hypothetical protein
LKTVDELMEKAFKRGRDPRSEEYKAGVRAVFEYRVNKVKIKNPYVLGTSQADAFYAGTEEGRAIWKEHESKSQAGR